MTGLDWYLVCVPLKNTVYALDGSTGALRWRFTTGGCVSTPVIGADGTIYFGSGHKVYALDGSTGALKWRFTTGGCVYSSPEIGPDGTIYVWSGDKVYALDGSTGAELHAPSNARGVIS